MLHKGFRVTGLALVIILRCDWPLCDLRFKSYQHLKLKIFISMHTAGTWWIFQPKSAAAVATTWCRSQISELKHSCNKAVWVWFSPHLSLVLLSNVSLSSTNPGPKKGTDNFLIGEQTSNLDQGMGVFVCGLQPTRIALWASIGRPSSQARVTSVNSSSSLMSPETRARRRGLSSSMGQGMFLTHFVVFDQTSSLDHNNITKLWPLDGSFGQSSVPFFGTQNCWGERDD